MSQCWQEGDWRAYLDGELTTAEMDYGREHLAQCEACSALHQEIAGRANFVGAMLMDLDAAPTMARPAIPARSGWKWAATGVALAAALVMAFVLAPKREEVAEAPVTPAAPMTAPITPTVAAPVLAVRHNATVRPRRARPQLQYFLAFDEEPIDTGTVMRVALEGGIEADVIVDASGRPRAIRAAR
jgi:anti-sigma factor RsiW